VTLCHRPPNPTLKKNREVISGLFLRAQERLAGRRSLHGAFPSRTGLRIMVWNESGEGAIFPSVTETRPEAVPIMMFADLALARRVEAGQARAGMEYARARVRLDPRSGAAWEPIAGGFAVFAGVDSPLTRASGMGLHGPADGAEWDRMESFFHGRGAAARVEFCPLADPSLLEWLGRRRYHPVEFENILVLPLGPGGDGARPPDGEIEVRRADPTEAEVWARTVAPGFYGPDPVGPEVLEMFTTLFHSAYAAGFLAWIDGRPAGGGAVLIYEGVATLCGASTLPSYRNRGVHAALHRARLAMAEAAGCDLAVVNALPGSPSQRNAERRGFRVAYTRAVLDREPA
jgi:GNAT superfamily N-acetyltransferase